MAKASTKTARRIGAEQSATRALLLEVTEQLMLEEGYAAASTRRVAAKASITPALVHYYFPTTDDLLLAVLRRAGEQTTERLRSAIESDDPLAALWTLSNDKNQTALALEFMALANHRKAIRAEIAVWTEKHRALQAEALGRLISKDRINPDILPPSALSVILAGISRAIVMEHGVGVSGGHAETKAFLAWCLDRLKQPPSDKA